MKKGLYCKFLAVGIIVLFVGVSVSFGFAIDINQSIIINKSKECRECRELSNAELVKVKQLFNRVEINCKLMLVLSRYDSEIKEKCEEILEIITSDSLLDFPIICGILESIGNQMFDILLIFSDLYEKNKNNPIIVKILGCLSIPFSLIDTIVYNLGIILGCY